VNQVKGFQAGKGKKNKLEEIMIWMKKAFQTRINANL
jgi:hypothetical protein